VAVTRSWTAARSQPAVLAVSQPPQPRAGMVWLAGASLLVAGALLMVYAAKTQSFSKATLLVNLNALSAPGNLAPVLAASPLNGDRERITEEVFAAIQRARPLRNVGQLAKLGRGEHLPLARLKPLMAVRTPDEFRRQLLLSACLYFSGFYLVAAIWGWAGFRGDRLILPALHLLSGIGFCLMVSLRDPLRDTLEFRKFALGVFLGCLLLALPAWRGFTYQRFSDWCYTPLFAALGLFGMLLAFGRGPAGNDAKVNLGPFQPVELIKVFLVLFLAGYFTRNWDRLRDLRERRLLPRLFRRLGMARAEHVFPVLLAVGGSLGLFFVLKDLGPALVTFFVFLTMFGAARARPGLVTAGLLFLVGAIAAGYRIGQPHTVVDRIHMWLSPWNNEVRGGDQLAHALWGFATGGLFGSGPGWGDPAMIPTGNTDLVLPAIGEEWGFLGVAAVFLLFGFLVARSLRAALRAGTHYGFFLGLGLSSLIAFEILLISAGALGVLPLSGVVSPFLSSGNTAMLANFAIFALLLSISAGDRGPAEKLPHGIRPLQIALASAAVILLAAAARYQVIDDREFLARDVPAVQADGIQRPQRNPRLSSVASEIPRGAIYDRNGIPLATSSWEELERRRAEYQALGVSIDHACSRFESRHYPFGSATALIVGDLRTRENFSASNASLIERDSNQKLQGYRYEELAALVRARHQPGNAEIARILARDRAVRSTLDIRLQLRVQEILQRHLHNQKGAAVVLQAATGDVLAMVSEPSPNPPALRTAAPSADELLDRARYGQYPPGSTFKLVTAIAALSHNPELRHRAFLCRSLADGRAGNWIAGWNRPIKDDIGDRAHGTLDMERALAVSCNAYFAQLGVRDVGAKTLAETASRMGLSTGSLSELRKMLPFAAYGQGPVLASPFQMARVSAAIAAGGLMPEGRWQTDSSNTRTEAPLRVLAEPEAAFLAAAMRRVVTEGTARRAMAGLEISLAGKTGTAQVDLGMPHSWFVGFAPYDSPPAKRLAFAVLVEHGGYGALAAAPIAREMMEAAKSLGLL
jgi:cell division protein FtsI/penicillin-binding protein 2/cell division protein FtsW (lipid II flippase)